MCIRPDWGWEGVARKGEMSIDPASDQMFFL